MEPLAPFLQALLDGVMIGGVYAVLSVGLSLVFGVMGIVHFAHAEFLMVGMFVAYFLWLYLGLDPMIGAFIALGLVLVAGMGIQQVLIKPILSAPEVAQIFLTVGLLFAMENGALLLFGADFRSVVTPYQTQALLVWSALPAEEIVDATPRILVGLDKLYAFGMALLIGACVFSFMQFTRAGRAMRATAQDPMAATLMGIDTNLMHRLAFGIGVGATAFGGAVILPYIAASPTIGTQYVVLMFTAVVLGGLGSVAGAVVGGVAVGIIQSVSALFLPIQLQNFVLFIVFILVLAFRPEGILSRRRA